jgi:diguanylate cyclase (GGDEF)-like protein/PAS domain S-box-containing protein
MNQVSEKPASFAVAEVVYKTIKASEEKFRSLFETAPDAIVLSNVDGIIISWNKSAEHLLKYTYEEIIGKSLLLIIPKRFRNEHCRRWLSLQKIPPKTTYERLDLKVLSKDGEEIPVELSIGYWKINGDIFFTTIFRNMSERKQFEDQLKYLATVDHLTGILNRRTGLMLIEQALKTAKRTNSEITLSYLDLDNFKRINDGYGHVEGDKALRKVAEIIKNDLRESDIFCRLGGDEFIIAWYNINLNQAKIQWKRILNKFNKWNEGQYNSTLGISAGFVCPDLSGKINLDKIIDLADRAMYQAKDRK